jgi:hypothetical protein
MRRDGNHTEIVRALRAAGISVQETHRVGSGFPDLVWGFRQVTGLLELKMPGAELEAHQSDWHAAWRGSPVLVARTPEEAVSVILRAVRGPRA